MKRILPWAAFIAGLVAIVVLIPMFNAGQPAGIRLTRGEARPIADKAARNLGIPVDRAWSVLSWDNSDRLSKELETNSDRRRNAAADPVIGPRLGFYHARYYRRGLEKYPEFGYVA